MAGARGMGRLAAAVLVGATACGRSNADATATTSLSAVDSTLTVAGRPIPPALLNRYVAQRLGFTSRGGEMRCAYLPLGVAHDRAFINTLCLEIVRDGDSLVVGSGRAGPVALRVARDGDSVRVVSHEEPVDGEGHAASIRRILPRGVTERIFAPTPVHNEQVQRLESYLRGEAAGRLGLRP